MIKYTYFDIQRNILQIHFLIQIPFRIHVDIRHGTSYHETEIDFVFLLYNVGRYYDIILDITYNITYYLKVNSPIQSCITLTFSYRDPNHPRNFPAVCFESIISRAENLEDFGRIQSRKLIGRR